MVKRKSREMHTPDDPFSVIFDDEKPLRPLPGILSPGAKVHMTPGPLAIPMIHHVVNPSSSSGGGAGGEGEGGEQGNGGDGMVGSDPLEALSRNLVKNHQVHIRENPYEFVRQLGAWAQGTGWRSYNEYVGSRIFYEGFSGDIISRIMHSEQLNRRIRRLAETRLKQLSLPDTIDRDRKLVELEEQLRDVARSMAVKMVSKMDSIQFLRFFGASINNILVRTYHQGIHISVQEFLEFRQVAVQAAEKKQSLLILPCHKSMFDFLTISWLFFRLGLALPHIVAGENLNLPIVGSMLQKCGAFFIRRSFGDDALYPVVIREYIEQLLENGHNLECFIEGGRSRTGKLLPPKLGILKYVLEGLQAGRTSDVWICPISVQYDKVIETESYVNELLGNPKEKESLWGLITNTRVLQLRMGRIDVRFQKPYSLKAFIADQLDRRKTIKGPGGEQIPFDIEKNNDHKIFLLRALGYQVLSDINKVAVIMPAALVGTVILTLRGRGVGRKELIRRVDWLRNAITARGGRVAEFAGMSTGEVVDRALEVMKDLIGVHHELIEPTFYALKRFELSFYRNQIIHLFVSEAMLSATLYTRVKQGGAAPAQRMPLPVMLEELGFLSQLLKNEFVYGTEGLQANAMNTVSSLERDSVVLVEDDLIGLSPKERKNGRENFDFYCFLIWPFVETYWLSAVSLFALTPTVEDTNSFPGTMCWFDEKDFHKRAQHFGKSLFYQGDVSYLEAINQATLLNAFERLSELGVIQNRRSKASKSIPLLSLHPDWIPVRNEKTGEIKNEGKLWSFLERLGSFRREGKNRRDNSTVSTRVFGLASMVTPPVVERTTVPRAETATSDSQQAQARL